MTIPEDKTPLEIGRIVAQCILVVRYCLYCYQQKFANSSENIYSNSMLFLYSVRFFNLFIYCHSMDISSMNVSAGRSIVRATSLISISVPDSFVTIAANIAEWVLYITLKIPCRSLGQVHELIAYCTIMKAKSSIVMCECKMLRQSRYHIRHWPPRASRAFFFLAKV